MHDVHTCSRFGAPFTTARTRCTLGFHRRLVRRCEWLTFMPNPGFLPQISHTDAMEVNLPEQNRSKPAKDPIEGRGQRTS
jgi:hypothetical protein